MSEEKLPGDHIDFNLNLKIIQSPFFDFLVSFVSSDISVRNEIQGAEEQKL